MKNSSNSTKSVILNKNNIFKIVVCAVILFGLGVMLGVGFTSKSGAKIQGSIFDIFNFASNSNASWSNASWSSSSWANSSWSSASWASSSWSSASWLNVSTANDNVLYLSVLKLKQTEVYAGNDISLNIETTGATLKSASIMFEDNSTKNTFTSSLTVYSGGTPHITVPKNTQSGSYAIKNVLLVGQNSNGTTFTKQYNSSNFTFADTLIVKPQASTNTQSVSPITLKSLSIKDTSVVAGDKVNINYEADNNPTKIKLIFNNLSGEELIVYVKSLESKPYFELPSTVKADTYNLTSVILSNSEVSTTYPAENITSTNKSFIVKESTKISNYVYNTDDLNENVISSIYNSKSGTVIKINADSNPIITSELFNAVKGKNKKVVINYDNNEIVFNGTDISDVKSIDASVTASTVSSDTVISSYIDNGILLDFASNGNLPGTATVRIKSTSDISSELNNKVYLYYFNPDVMKFEYIDKVKKDTKDNYYEFNISHTSQYVLVNEKLSSDLVYTQTSVNTVKSNNTLLWVLCGVCVVAIIAVVLLILKQKNKNKTVDVK